jgi:regulator of cell morphogenesis and NO signaling
LKEAENKPLSASQDFNKWELDFLSDYISHTHHRYVKENAKVINGLTEEVAQHHGLDHPELNRLAQSVPMFLQNLLAHISKEEKVAFPAIRQAVGKQHGAPAQQAMEPDIIRQSALLLQKEHAIMSEDLAYIRRLTGNYRLPGDACNSYTYLYQKLEEMENDLKQYMHVENNILFPKAVALEKEVA